MIQDQRENDSHAAWIVFLLVVFVVSAIYVLTAPSPLRGRIACEQAGGTWIEPPRGRDLIAGEDSSERNPYCSVRSGL